MRNRVVVLALILILIARGVYATGGPSRTNADLYDVEVTNTDGTQVPARLNVITVPETETTLAILEQPDMNALELRELAGLRVLGYTEDIGDLRGSFNFPSRFRAGIPLIVRIGLIEGERIIWVPLAHMVNEAGNVDVTLPRAILGQITADNAVIAVYYHTGFSGEYAAIEIGDLLE